MAKFRVKYTRGDKETTFETIVEVNNASSPNQAMIKIKDEAHNYKDLNFSDVQILKVEKVDSWE
jgi:hypothetical protein